MHNGLMNLAMDIGLLTRAEKLRAMEALWKDLSQSDEEYPTPEWHGDILRERAAAIADGSDAFIPWEEAKKQLRARTK